MRSSWAAHEVLAAGIVAPPAAERRQHARGDLRIEPVERQQLVGDQRIAGAVGAMEACRVPRERADQRARPVRVLERERLVAEQPRDLLDGVGPLGLRLQREPLVDHQRIARQRS